MLLAPYVCFHIFSYVKVTEWPPIGKIAAHSAYDMFHGIKYLIVSLVFSHLSFWSGTLFLVAPFPDLCLLVHFYLLSYYGIFTLGIVRFLLPCRLTFANSYVSFDQTASI